MFKLFLPCLVLLASSCNVLIVDKSALNEQIQYQESHSKRTVLNEQEEAVPQSVRKRLRVVLNENEQLLFEIKTIQKKDSVGRYEEYSVQLDTLKRRGKTYNASEIQLSGNYKRTPLDKPFVVLAEKNDLTFYANGTCEEKWKSYCSDSPCWTNHVRYGIYRVINDTLNVKFYLHEKQFSQSSKPYLPKLVDEAVRQYTLSSSGDSLLFIMPQNSSVRLPFVKCSE